jgi:hypothetical protein
MIGTPNSGTKAAFWQYYGCPFGSDFDLFQGSQATHAADSQSTHYYTIAGDYAWPCFLVSTIPFASCYLLPNDGFVTVHSAQCSYDHCYTSLVARPFPYNHEGLLTQKDVYDKVLPVLSSGH